MATAEIQHLIQLSLSIPVVSGLNRCVIFLRRPYNDNMSWRKNWSVFVSFLGAYFHCARIKGESALIVATNLSTKNYYYNIIKRHIHQDIQQSRLAVPFNITRHASVNIDFNPSSIWIKRSSRDPN
jgi:hypothetical protein